jgi:hypothetical protein
MQNDLDISDSFLSPLFEEIFVVKERDFSIEYNSLGAGHQKILMLVNTKSADYLESEELLFLKTIIEKGLRRSFDDVWVVNLDRFPSKNLEDICNHFQPTQLIAWGLDQWLGSQGVNLAVHKNGLVNGVEIIQALSLTAYKTEPAQKARLWATLQKVFFN